MENFGIEQAVPRFEDSRLLRGRGRFQDDCNRPDQAHAVMLRSPHAHARVLNVDTVTAKAAPGVLAAYRCRQRRRRPRDAEAVMPRKRPDRAPMFAPQRPARVVGRVRHVGDPAALIVAEPLAQAKDAAEPIDVD